jgi:hypothetical protein
MMGTMGNGSPIDADGGFWVFAGSTFDHVRNPVAALAADGARTSDAHRFFAMIAD